MPTDERRLNSPQSVTRVIQILEILCASSTPIGLAQISRALDAPKSSIAALLRGLVDAGFVGDGADDGALPDHWITLEIHLGDEALREGVAEDREVDVRRAPVIGAVGPGIGAGLNGAEAVEAVGIGERTAAAAEIGIKRGEIALSLVTVAATGIGLPHFDQRVGHRARVLIEHLAVVGRKLFEGPRRF